MSGSCCMIYIGCMGFSGCFKPCFPNKRSLCYPALWLCMHGCVCACLSVPFPGLPESWFASHLREEHSYQRCYIPKSFEKTWQLVGPWISLRCRREREDASSYIPQRHFVSSMGKIVMGTCTLRDNDGEQNYIKSALVPALTERLWASCSKNYKNTRKMVKGALRVLSPGRRWRA